MAKKLGKILLFTAAAGSAAAAAYYFMQKKAASRKASEDEDYDNFTIEDEEPGSSHTYVPLTPEAKDSEAKAPGSCAEGEAPAACCSKSESSAAEPSASDAGSPDSSGAADKAAAPAQEPQESDPGFVPFSERFSQESEVAESVEEFFNEDADETEKAE